MEFFDKAVEAGNVRITKDGYLVATARIARTGIQDYHGSEVDPQNKHGLRDRSLVKVYRPPEEVFADKAMRSFAYRPMTNDHPKNNVNATNWRKHAVGITGHAVKQADKYIEVPLSLMDEGAIKDFQNGKKELSCGYTCELDFTAGVTPEGVQYDAVQRNITGNHLALVKFGRAGSECRIGDDQPEPKPEGGRKVMETINATFDSIPYVSTQGAEAIIAKQRSLLSDAANALTTADTAHKTALADKDKELATKDAEIADLKTKIVTGDALDAMVAERSAIVTKAKTFDAKFDPKGKSNIEIMRAVVGDAAKDKSDDYVQAAFDLKTVDSKKPAASGSLEAVIGDSAQAVKDARTLRDEARAKNLARLNGETEAAAA